MVKSSACPSDSLDAYASVGELGLDELDQPRLGRSVERLLVELSGEPPKVINEVWLGHLVD